MCLMLLLLFLLIFILLVYLLWSITLPFVFILLQTMAFFYFLIFWFQNIYTYSQQLSSKNPSQFLFIMLFPILLNWKRLLSVLTFFMFYIFALTHLIFSMNLKIRCIMFPSSPFLLSPDEGSLWIVFSPKYLLCVSAFHGDC